MSRIEKEVTIMNAQGLHARPAAIFVQIASKFNCAITVRKDAERVNGKSIMGVLMLAAERNSKITIEAEGEDAEQAIAELDGFLSRHE
jgi:phosphocarrier protein